MIIKNPYTRFLIHFNTALLIGVIFSACNRAEETTLARVQDADTTLPEIEYIEPSSEGNTSLAVVVKMSHLPLLINFFHLMQKEV